MSLCPIATSRRGFPLGKDAFLSHICVGRYDIIGPKSSRNWSFIALDVVLVEMKYIMVGLHETLISLRLEYCYALVIGIYGLALLSE